MWHVLDPKQVASYNWKFGHSAGPLCEAVSSPGKPFLFVWSFGGGGAFCRKDVSLLKSFCTKKMSRIVSRATAFARWTLFFCVWFLKGVFAHPVRFGHGLSNLFEGVVLSNTKLRDTAECQVFLINVLSTCMDFRHIEPYCVSSDPRGGVL